MKKVSDTDQKRLQAEINKGLNKHQALNSIHGAGQVKAPKAK